jgi:hypothetical protein
VRRFWQIALPLAGLLVFGLVSRREFQIHRELPPRFPHAKYFFWAATRLDTDPQNRIPHQESKGCNSQENCVTWDLSQRRGTGLLPALLALTAIPVFLIDWPIRSSLGHFGVSELTTFMWSMPILLALWYYIVGRWFDNRRNRKSQRYPKSAPTA